MRRTIVTIIMYHVLSHHLVLGDGRPELGGAVVGVGGHEVSVGRAQRLQELGHDRGGVLGQGQIVLDKCTLVTRQCC